jgi:O-succinylhomoserine sulfhydrylase
LQIRLQAQSARHCSWRSGWRSTPRGACLLPWLPSHPQFELARRQQKSGGAIVSFVVKGARAEAWKVVDSCRLLSITANLGDTKTTLTHPASTTHGRITPEQRAAAGITENLLRVAVGLEAVVDLQNDLETGLSSI